MYRPCHFCPMFNVFRIASARVCVQSLCRVSVCDCLLFQSLDRHSICFVGLSCHCVGSNEKKKRVCVVHAISWPHLLLIWIYFCVAAQCRSHRKIYSNARELRNRIRACQCMSERVSHAYVLETSIQGSLFHISNKKKNCIHTVIRRSEEHASIRCLL